MFLCMEHQWTMKVKLYFSLFKSLARLMCLTWTVHPWLNCMAYKLVRTPKEGYYAHTKFRMLFNENSHISHEKWHFKLVYFACFHTTVCHTEVSLAKIQQTAEEHLQSKRKSSQWQVLETVSWRKLHKKLSILPPTKNSCFHHCHLLWTTWKSFKLILIHTV